MTERERKLAIIVCCFVPLALLFFGFMTFLSSYDANQASITRLDNQIETQDTLLAKADAANIRGKFYREFSLPSNFNKSMTQYRRMITKIAEDECGLKIKSQNPEKGGPVRLGSETIYYPVTINLRADGRLEQVTQFLQKFYSLNLIHRVSTLSLIPVNEGKSEDEYKRTGIYSVEMSIDVISMKEADPAREFEEVVVETKTLDDYNKAILYRNMFGPANNPPQVTKKSHSFKPTADEVSFKIDAKDVDKNDLLSFELVNCEISGAQLERRRDTDRSAWFTCPSLEPGDYKFDVKVTDSGAPNKSDEIEFTLTIETNGKPALASRSKSLKESRSDVSFKIEAKDPDRGDKLTLELVSSEIEGATLEQSSSRAKYAKFECPPLAVGSYESVIRITDDGMPSHTVEETFTIEVTENNKPQFASATAIAAIKEDGGKTSVTINFRIPENRFEDVAIGESFELDEQTWTVRRVENRSIIIERGGELLTFNLKGRHNMLDSPVSTEEIAESPSEEESSEAVTDPTSSVDR